MNIPMISLDALNEVFEDYIDFLKKEVKDGIYTKYQIINMATNIFREVINISSSASKEVEIIDKNTIN